MDRISEIYSKFFDIIFKDEAKRYGFYFNRKDYLKKIGEVDKLELEVNKENSEKIKKLQSELKKQGFTLTLKEKDSNNSKSKLKVQIIGVQSLFTVFFSNIVDYYIFKHDRRDMVNSDKLIYLGWIYYNIRRNESKIRELNENMLKIKKINLLEIDVSVFYLQLFYLIYSKLNDYYERLNVKTINILANLLINQRLHLNGGIIESLNIDGINTDYERKFKDLNEYERKVIIEIYKTLSSIVFDKQREGKPIDFVEDDLLRKTLVTGLNEYINVFLEELKLASEYLNTFGNHNIPDFYTVKENLLKNINSHLDIPKFDRDLIINLICIEELKNIISNQLEAKNKEFLNMNANTNVGINSSNTTYVLESLEKQKVNTYLNEMQKEMITEIFRIQTITRKDISEEFLNDTKVLNYLITLFVRVFGRDIKLFETEDKTFIKELKEYFNIQHLSSSKLSYFKIHKKYIPIEDLLKILSEPPSESMNKYFYGLFKLVKQLVFIYISDNFTEMKTVPIFVPLLSIYSINDLRLNKEYKDIFINRVETIELNSLEDIKYQVQRGSILENHRELFDLISRADKDERSLYLGGLRQGEEGSVFIDFEQMNYPNPNVIPYVKLGESWDYPFDLIQKCSSDPKCLSTLERNLERYCDKSESENNEERRLYHKYIEQVKLFRNIFSSNTYLLTSGEIDYLQILPRIINRMYYRKPEDIYVKVNVITDISNFYSKENETGYQIWKFLVKHVDVPVNQDLSYKLCP